MRNEVLSWGEKEACVDPGLFSDSEEENSDSYGSMKAVSAAA
jgi:hypothetical protein